ncbi:MAG TPA: 2-oxoglutarate dehydrogenase complex dihydrolipoyllysine-residue succinyltransferase [Coxiellaceae bacterium]|nr:2-oxoglutarate dehydrogenase complex dihydrolipoyllysine-residue succinyltransferase [Coxiellaceae bacterium]
MSIEIKVPGLPESVADATVAKWYKKAGDSVERDEKLLDLETDKVVLEVSAPANGVLESITAKEGATVKAGDVLGAVKEGVAGSAPKAVEKESTPAKTLVAEKPQQETSNPVSDADEFSPSVRRLIAEHGLNIKEVKGTGKDGRVTKEDVEQVIKGGSTAPSAKISVSHERKEERVAMSRLRARVAQRLVQVQQESALLTTFNEVNMKSVMDLRTKYKDAFEKKHGVRLGFMSFFVKAVVDALKQFPIVNASIDGQDVLYHNYFDVGIAIASPRGLVVPILRDTDQLSMAGIERGISDFANKAKNGQLTLDDMQGGTFTITNGGVFGSMLSTPIINPPQSAILGMHNIVERAVVESGQILARPIMYLALSYDHRIIDGADSVRFLVAVKEYIENPGKALLEL